MGINYEKQFLAHAQAKKSLVLHGQSGEGKTSEVHSFGQKYGYDVNTLLLCYIDPMDLSIPIENASRPGVLTHLTAEFIIDLCTPEGKPTILFLDEFTRPAKKQTQFMLTELLNDRSFMKTNKLRDNVFIVGATNLTAEDTGVEELHDAVLRRVTHLNFVPSTVATRIKYAATDLEKRILTENGSKFERIPEEFKVPNLNCSRQFRDACIILSQKDSEGNFILSTLDDVEAVAIGRLGEAHGRILAQLTMLERDNQKNEFPEILTESFFPTLAKLQYTKPSEVVNFLHDMAVKAKGNEVQTNLEMENRELALLVAKFILRDASLETINSFMKISDFQFVFAYKLKGEGQLDANPFEEPYTYIEPTADGTGVSRTITKDTFKLHHWIWFSVLSPGYLNKYNASSHRLK